LQKKIRKSRFPGKIDLILRRNFHSFTTARSILSPTFPCRSSLLLDQHPEISIFGSQGTQLLAADDIFSWKWPNLKIGTSLRTKNGCR